MFLRIDYSVMKHHTPKEKNFQQWNCLRTFSESGIFPDRLQIAEVKPLYKGGAIHDVQKYKPISFLLYLKKTQKLMYNR